MKFKKGDRCRITGNSNHHEFEIGEEVEIDGEKHTGGGYKAWHLDRRNWWLVRPEDMELITEYSPDLTLMQKFEAGWVFTHENGDTIVDMVVLKSRKIAVEWADGVSSIVDNEQEILRYHTITPPVESMFTGMGCEPLSDGKAGFYSIEDCETLEEAKEAVKLYNNFGVYPTCILEHHKVDGKWVFVKAHNV